MCRVINCSVVGALGISWSLVNVNSQGFSEGAPRRDSLTFLPCLRHEHEGDCYRHAKQPHQEQFHRVLRLTISTWVHGDGRWSEKPSYARDVRLGQRPPRFVKCISASV